MTFNLLEIDPAVARQGNEDSLSSLTDKEIISLNKTMAKVILKQDIVSIFRLAETDTNSIDSYVDKYAENFKLALMYLQLYLYYFERDAGEGSKARFRLEAYFGSYQALKSNFKNFDITTNTNSIAGRAILG